MEGGSTSALRLVLLFGVALLARAADRVNATEVKEIFNFRWRYESFDTLSNDSALDSQYDFHNLRTRFGADLDWNRFTVHGLLQAANAVSLPDRGSFGPGRVYFASSGGADTSPGHLDLAELMVGFKVEDAWSFRVGRQGIVDGQEVLTGDPRFDWVKQTRLSERLVGTWDWVNVGRRFDGVTISFDRPRFNVTGFGARVLQGGVDYDDAFEQLDSVDVGAVVYTSKRSAWISGSEVRLFDALYRDGRASTRVSLGDAIFIQAIGASFVGMYGGKSGTADVVAWFALETGDYGTQDQGGSAFILEGGYGWPRLKAAPWLRLGLATASGDDDPTDEDQGTFFNMVPTNHKYYGYQDLVAFQNLTNLYAQARFEPVSKLRVLVEGHVFRLRTDTDFWYAGSGAANNVSFGYEARGSLAHGSLPKSIGSEIDLIATWTPRPSVGFELAYSYFRGGALARQLYPVESRSSWFYFMTTFSR